MTIGAFARSCGVTASALRFYADSGLLVPALVDGASAYRYYAPDQVARATLIRQLRELDLSLAQIAEVLDADAPATAERLIDEHVDALTARLAAADGLAAAAKRTLRRGAGPTPPDPTPTDPTPTDPGPPGHGVTVTGAVFVAAVEQVLTATAWDPAFPVLNGVHLEAGDGSLTLTATDRYRLATRTLVPREHGATPWAVTVRGTELWSMTPWLRRRPVVRLQPRGPHLEAASGDDVRRCTTLGTGFPDHRRMLAALPEPATRALLARHRLLAALETAPAPHVRLVVDETVTVGSRSVPATVTGPPVVVDFDLSTLYPTISSAVGPEVMLELTDPDQPVLVRSADTGDLTAVAMPIRVE